MTNSLDLSNTSVNGKVAIITGSSRGIGRAIALKLAKQGASIVVVARTENENEKVSGTIHSVVSEITSAGGKAIAVACDVRKEDQVQAVVDAAVKAFGGVDIIVNNAGVLSLTDTEQTDLKLYDLMQSINTRGVFALVKFALPYLKQSKNAHILNICPPINLDPGWVGGQLPYTVSKYGMSLLTMGWAHEFKKYGIGVNSLWPVITIDTAAVRVKLGGEETAKRSRTTAIVADAASIIINKAATVCSGNYYLDEDVLKAEGITEFTGYAVDATAKPLTDLYVGVCPPDFRTQIENAAAFKTKSAPAKAPEPVVATSEVKHAQPVFKAFDLKTADGVTELSFKDPNHYNALGISFWTELPAAIEWLVGQKATRMMLIHGQGHNFSSGIDLAIFKHPALKDVATDAGKQKLGAFIGSMQAAINAVSDAPFPVMAAIEGVCWGAALDLIAACDFRYATESASFSIAEVNIGLMADLGSLQRLPRIMPEGLVREMAYTGMRIDGARAHSVGLVNAVYKNSTDMYGDARMTCGRIASMTSSAVQASKKAFDHNGSAAIANGLERAVELQLQYLDMQAVGAILSQKSKS
ncbi:MAG: NAD(P)-dependent oxidoreductase [Cyanobacteriota bacterium erpe_2018_sw_39hr_WHONDRS-SW48-000098_B_bin.30]|jgi:citronellol/citronellal dehydrogenase|nr:SDR family oxidoreductase [Candidatus Obscuribacter sp.]MDQ5964274.1 NAD(P)-dependent oxidoreductase [Cyanobacteriota bacterium erpe_2018_sw_39hr_WHONDRS-SW48-000098_B_bin.30]